MKPLLQSSYCVQSPMSTVEPISSWEEDRKFVLRAWCLVFIILATAMLLSVLDGRMAYLHGAYTGYVGFWTNCKKHTCADLRQVTVLIHMSMGFMILAVILALVLLLAMGFSFRPALRRLNKTDLVFSTLSSFTGLLILLSLTLFIANCEMLKPRPQVSYLVTTYLSWGASALMLWAGILSYLNYMGMWGKGTSSTERRMSYRRWASLQNTRKSISEQLSSDAGSKHAEDLSV
ncbi:transmembrane protein 202-like isoform X4 [Bos indicus]|uniref:Transmembrane protein 202-like isoform X2 n=2 Tax=Bovinae TaxID=27592 RepID=A0A6P3I810_BISBB|nr:transmembrane protein 202 isoform X5 [Bos taurus]XP_010847969.1 PREDICTED: transmembrane protein 202-like isoform X2 [Bison bison bison]XP_027370813.1 transmembrane protein 202-like isoform X2 [Bos indicus x Bos taurus]